MRKIDKANTLRKQRSRTKCPYCTRKNKKYSIPAIISIIVSVGAIVMTVISLPFIASDMGKYIRLGVDLKYLEIKSPNEYFLPIIPTVVVFLTFAAFSYFLEQYRKKGNTLSVHILKTMLYIILAIIFIITYIWIDSGVSLREVFLGLKNKSVIISLITILIYILYFYFVGYVAIKVILFLGRDILENHQKRKILDNIKSSFKGGYGILGVILILTGLIFCFAQGYFLSLTKVQISDNHIIVGVYKNTFIIEKCEEKRGTLLIDNNQYWLKKQSESKITNKHYNKVTTQ